MFGEVLDAHLSVTSSPSTCSCAGVRGGINAKGWGGGLERGGLSVPAGEGCNHLRVSLLPCGCSCNLINSTILEFTEYTVYNTNLSLTSVHFSAFDTKRIEYIVEWNLENPSV